MALAARHLASISDEKLQELRDRVDLVAVVQRRVPLKKSGHDWKGLCPFHGEKTPSFYVVPDKKMFHCFGCGVSGDAIKFIMQVEGRSFREAVEQLANEAGVDLTPQDPEEVRRSSRRAALAEVNEKACTFYERILWDHPKGKVARDHLRERGITEDTARAWRLGYAPNLWDSLINSHALKGVDSRLAEEAGLGIPRKKGQGLYDRFRGRLMIPIRESGRIVGFGGRLLEGQSEAKYLNSPDTPLYQKGLTLFALDRARESIRRDAVALFVEGYFDAIGLHQAGVVTAVATCGTALTDKHLELVTKAGARELVFVFDGDAAGMRAAKRASETAAPRACRPACWCRLGARIPTRRCCAWASRASGRCSARRSRRSSSCWIVPWGSCRKVRRSRCVCARWTRSRASSRRRPAPSPATCTSRRSPRRSEPELTPSGARSLERPLPSPPRRRRRGVDPSPKSRCPSQC